MTCLAKNAHGKVHDTKEGLARPVCGGGNGGKTTLWQVDIGPSNCLRCHQIAEQKRKAAITPITPIIPSSIPIAS